MRIFYSEFALVAINLQPLKIKFFPYAMAFSFLDKESSLIPIAIYNDSKPIYMDKYPDGSWDERIQMEIGDGKVQILGEDIFDFLINLANQMNQY